MFSYQNPRCEVVACSFIFTEEASILSKIHFIALIVYVMYLRLQYHNYFITYYNEKNNIELQRRMFSDYENNYEYNMHKYC